MSRQSFKQVTANTQLTSTTTYIKQIVVTGKNAANTAFLFNEVSGTGTSIAMEVPIGPTISQITFMGPGAFFASGCSISCPTSVSFSIQYEI
jgi:hypothetical protein